MWLFLLWQRWLQGFHQPFPCHSECWKEENTRNSKHNLGVFFLGDVFFSVVLEGQRSLAAAAAMAGSD